MRTTERIDKLGARVINEIDDVMALIADVLGLTAGFDDSLKSAAEKLGAAGSREADEVNPGDAGNQQGAGESAGSLEGRDQQPSA